jgi:phosphoglycolate phosphatase-like HAD superfamily hydrolase
MIDTPTLEPAAAYALWAEDYPPYAHNPLMQAEEQAMLALLPGTLGGLRILDAGCGSGRYLMQARRRGAGRVVGVDLSAEMLARARAELRIENEELRMNSPLDQFSILNFQFSIPERLFQALDFDYKSGRVIPGGRFAVEPMARLREITVGVLRTAGLHSPAAEQIVDEVWYYPDPVALAQPLADLPAIFRALRARGLRIAVATSDDHAPTEATLASLGVASLVDAIAGADDGLPNKPAPDMVLRLCHELDVSPAQTLVVGDAVADMQMGRAASAGMVVGVLSGLSSAALLAPHADVVIDSVADLIAM